MAKKKQVRFNLKEIGATVLGTTVGAVSCEIVSSKLLPNANPLLVGIGKIVIGALIPEISPRSKFLGGVGAGFVAVGGAQVAKKLLPAGFIAGIGQADDDLIEDADQDEGFITDSDFDDEVQGLPGTSASDVLSEGSVDSNDDVSGTGDVKSDVLGYIGVAEEVALFG